MRQSRQFLRFLIVGTLATELGACGAPGSSASDSAGVGRSPGDSAFAALQTRGADPRAMGVDQYKAQHVFESLPDGGRIELQVAVQDSADVAVIRRHLREIAVAFSAGDFAIPMFVHMQDVPGTVVMASSRSSITYEARDLPGGGEVRITTRDPRALAAVHEFLTFQRTDHRAVGSSDSTPDHATHDHAAHGKR